MTDRVRALLSSLNQGALAFLTDRSLYPFCDAISARVLAQRGTYRPIIGRTVCKLDNPATIWYVEVVRSRLGNIKCDNNACV